MRTEWIEVRGASVAVAASGTADPRSSSAGNSQSNRAFERQLDGALGRQFRLIAIDLPGHGESARAAEPAATYCLPGYAEVMVEVARTLGVSDGVFAGWSLGGQVVLEATGRLADAAGFFIFGTGSDLRGTRRCVGGGPGRRSSPAHDFARARVVGLIAAAASQSAVRQSDRSEVQLESRQDHSLRAYVVSTIAAPLGVVDHRC